MEYFNEKFPIPKWANVVDVTVDDGVVKVEFDTEEIDVLDDEDLENL